MLSAVSGMFCVRLSGLPVVHPVSGKETDGAKDSRETRRKDLKYGEKNFTIDHYEKESCRERRDTNGK